MNTSSPPTTSGPRAWRCRTRRSRTTWLASPTPWGTWPWTRTTTRGSASSLWRHSRKSKSQGWDVVCSMFRTALRLGWCLSEAVCGPGVRSECMCRYELRLGGLSNLVSQRRSLSLYLHLRSWDKLFLQVSTNLVCIRHHRSQWQLWWVPKLGPGGAWPVASQTCLWHHNDFANGQN